MPSWTKEQLAQHPMRAALLEKVNTKIQTPSSDNCLQSSTPLPPVATNEEFCQFTVPGEPMGKPRMTQRDKWQKRPVVLRYREYCDRIRAVAKIQPHMDCFAIEVTAHLPMPPSWSKKKRAEMLGKMHRNRPDWDNIGKAVCDALFEEDSILGGGTVWKFWCDDASPRTEITVLFYRQEPS